MKEELKVNDVKCPLCETTMRFIKKHAFWRCPSCKTEVWPSESKLKEIRVKVKVQNFKMLDGFKMNPHNEPLPAGPVDPSCHSGSKSGKRRKKPPKKKMPWDIE